MAYLDLYKLLEVPRNATTQAIRGSYFSKSFSFLEPNFDAEFKQLMVALQILVDPSERTRYDQNGLEALSDGFKMEHREGLLSLGYDFKLPIDDQEQDLVEGTAKVLAMIIFGVQLLYHIM